MKPRRCINCRYAVIYDHGTAPENLFYGSRFTFDECWKEDSKFYQNQNDNLAGFCEDYDEVPEEDMK